MINQLLKIFNRLQIIMVYMFSGRPYINRDNSTYEGFINFLLASFIS